MDNIWSISKRNKQSKTVVTLAKIGTVIKGYITITPSLFLSL